MHTISAAGVACPGRHRGRGPPKGTTASGSTCLDAVPEGSASQTRTHRRRTIGAGDALVP